MTSIKDEWGWDSWMWLSENGYRVIVSQPWLIWYFEIGCGAHDLTCCQKCWFSCSANSLSKDLGLQKNEKRIENYSHREDSITCTAHLWLSALLDACQLPAYEWSYLLHRPARVLLTWSLDWVQVKLFMGKRSNTSSIITHTAQAA